MSRTFRISALASLALAFLSSSARASLTPAEAAQVRDYYAGAKQADASQVRAFVARPDLSAEESATSLSAAVGGVAFTPQRAAFLKTLVFGGSSLPSRSVLAAATTRALLARASEVIAKNESDFDSHAEAVSEVTRILAFVDKEIAQAGPKRGVGGPPESGISPATYDDGVKALGETIALHPKWLKADAQLSVTASKVRAQTELALVDLMNDSPTFRVDAADKLGLAGARRSFYLETGVLPLDDGKASDARVEAARDIFIRMPAGRAAAAGVFFGDDKATFTAKKEVIVVKSSLASTGSGVVDLLPEDLASALPEGAGRVDPTIADLARTLAACTVRHALENRGDLALASTRDARAAIDAHMPLGKEPPPAPAPADATGTLAQAVELVVLDARAAFDIARNRFRANHPEAAALFSDAIGILAVDAGSLPSASGLSLALGKPKGDGISETIVAENVQLAPSGAGVGLTLGPWSLVVARDASGAVTAVTATGKQAPPKKQEPAKKPHGRPSTGNAKVNK